MVVGFGGGPNGAFVEAGFASVDSCVVAAGRGQHGEASEVDDGGSRDGG